MDLSIGFGSGYQLINLRASVCFPSVMQHAEFWREDGVGCRIQGVASKEHLEGSTNAVGYLCC